MKRLLVASLLSLCSSLALAQAPGVLGLWTEPSGSTIEIYRCGADLCARLVFLSANAPSLQDIHNPDAKLRGEPLCGLVIGKGFHLSTPDRAGGGQLYDPKNGKTYNGSMSSEGNRLNLRGYVGIKLFGRTETWTRASEGSRRCDRAQHPG